MSELTLKEQVRNWITNHIASTNDNYLANNDYVKFHSVEQAGEEVGVYSTVLKDTDGTGQVEFVDMLDKNESEADGSVKVVGMNMFNGTVEDLETELANLQDYVCLDVIQDIRVYDYGEEEFGTAMGKTLNVEFTVSLTNLLLFGGIAYTINGEYKRFDGFYGYGTRVKGKVQKINSFTQDTGIEADAIAPNILSFANDDIENKEITNLVTDFKVIPFPVNFLANFNTQLAAQEQRIQTLETTLNELISAVTPDPEPAEQEQQG